MLPIDHHRDEIVAAFAANHPLVLKAPPGAGKTTGIPPMLIDAPEMPNGQIWLIQPRRLAARTAAARIASTIGCNVGDAIGYHVRGDRKCDHQTRVIAMTTGMALRRLQSDPYLESVGAVLLDEFHERSLEIDLMLAMTLQLRRSIRDDLRIAVMSATLDPEPIVQHIDHQTGDDSVALVSEGRMYPVEIEYSGSVDWRSYQRIDQIASAIKSVFSGRTSGGGNTIKNSDSSDNASRDHDVGDVLVFLPGVAEIRGVEDQLSIIDADVRTLYGAMSPRQQDQSLRPSNRRRIFLATNIAETSLTIDGVTTVIDAGKSKVLTFDSKVGLPRLQLSDISIASADQRAGRAGRTCPGRAIRLWPADRHRFRRPEDTPEIERGDLTSSILQLIDWGETSVASLPWLTPPKPSVIQHALQLLDRLGAITVDDDEDAKIAMTNRGREMARLPVHPRIAAMLIEAKRHDIAFVAAVVATMLSGEDPTRRAGRSIPLSLVDRVSMVFGDGVAGNQTSSFRREVSRLCRRMEIDEQAWSRASIDFNNRSLAMSLLAGFADRLCRRREDDHAAAVMAGGRGVKWRGDFGESELLLALDLDDASTEAWVRLAMPIDRQWIDDDQTIVRHQYLWDEEDQRVIARAIRSFAGLTLQQCPEKVSPCEPVRTLLMEQSASRPGELIPVGGRAADLLLRWRWLAEVGCDVLPKPPSDGQILQWISNFANSATSFEMIRNAAWFDTFAAELGYENLRELDRLAPSEIQVPGGRWATIIYPDSAAESRPRIEARVGEMFGWHQTPMLAGGRVKLQLHLLSPAGRVEQITDDLQHFWSVTYTAVRKDLRARYPKHHWPEDPTTAKATRNGLKPR